MNLQNIIKKLVSCIYLLVITYIIYIIFSYKDYEYIHFIAKENYKALIIGTIMFILLTLIIKILLKIKFIENNILKIIYLLTLVIFLLQLLVTNSYYFTGGQDITTVLNNSYSLALNNNIVDEWYFSTYPNNIFIIFLYSNIIKITSILEIIEHTHFILITIMCILSSLTSIILFKTTYILTNNTLISCISWIYYTIIVSISGWLSVVYTDTLGLIFPISILFTYIKIKQGKNLIINKIILIILSALAISIKPQSFIIFVAILIYEIFIDKNTYKVKIKNTVTILIGLFVTLQIVGFITSDIKNNLDEEKNIGYLHYIKMGLNRESWGVFSSEDFTNSYNIKTKKDRDINNKEIIKQRIKEYDIKSYGEHIKRKTLLNFNNGTFGWYWMATFPEKNIISKETFLTNIFKNIYYSEGKYYKHFNFLQQSNWLVILILSSISIFTLKEREYKHIIYLTLIGLFIFVSIFEASARYLFTNIPIFIICAMYGVQNLIEIKNRIFNKKN